MPESQQQESLWVLRAQAGDREALDLLLRCIQQPIFSYLKQMIQDTAAAEDALQDVFLIVVRKVRTLREPSFFRAWVYRIAYRQALAVLRREKRWRKRDVEPQYLDGHCVDPTSGLGDMVERTEIESSLLRLSPKVRAVVSLHYLEELPIREVADILSIPVGTAKSRLTYGLQSLRGHLKLDPQSE